MGFTHISELIKHKKDHPQESEFSCQFCGKTFSEQAALIVHIAIVALVPCFHDAGASALREPCASARHVAADVAWRTRRRRRSSVKTRRSSGRRSSIWCVRIDGRACDRMRLAQVDSVP